MTAEFEVGIDKLKLEDDMEDAHDALKFKEGVDKTTKLIIDYVVSNQFNGAVTVASMTGIIMNILFDSNFTWPMVELYFQDIMKQARPVFESKP